ncbi:hypothetical protein TRFO_33156 [Tritrichomonas foetus]|uniref:Uncharacterized protein n=1 Tax=Tritrichomonas foetus TaxID=1144522 RepID=A0A1J4JM78_9EUKA|nr:hypothetical protein TRFO_33156 [Tritrichomonas foetus]|eukprot:OHT00207.1 hypothetical protein TRFO_33156 [Tritrichomonas foetus]
MSSPRRSRIRSSYPPSKNTSILPSIRYSPYNEEPIGPISPTITNRSISPSQKDRSSNFQMNNIAGMNSNFDINHNSAPSFSIERYSPRKYYPPPPREYHVRTKFLNRVQREYQEKMSQKYRPVNSPYTYDNLGGMEKSIYRTQNMLIERDMRDNARQMIISRQSKRAIQESYKHELFHKDKMINGKDKALRIIPVTDRFHCDLPLSQLPII